MEEVNDPIDLEMQLLSSFNAQNHGGVSSARQMMQRAIRVVQCVQMFLAGANHSKYEETEEAVYDECVNSDQTIPLLLDNSTNWHLRKLTKRLIHVLQSIEAFKTHKTSERKPVEVVEASDSLVTSSEHHVTIDQTTVTNQITVDQLQHSPSKNIKILSMIVRQKNFSALEEFGGLDGVEFVLGTNLINGISKIEARNRSRVSTSLASTHTFFQLISKEVKKTTIILLLLAVLLSTVFEINEEGLKYGCYDGVIVLIAIILQVFVASIHKYLEEKRTQKKLQKHQGRVGQVLVKRGGDPEVIFESELVWGDLVLLKTGDEVPCDGLFVSGDELLELDYGSETCIINHQNPFLSYGQKVINGDAIMVVTSTNIETEWNEMMSKDPNKRFKLETQIDKLNNRMHVIQIINSILIILVLAFRFIVGKIDDQNVYRPESMAEPTAIRSFAVTFKNVIKESTYTAKVLTKLLSVSLVGLTEGVPFVVSLAIVYWNDKTLFGKANEQDPHCVVKMACVTRICIPDTFITGVKMEVEKHIIGGEFICELVNNVVKNALRDGIGTLKEKQFYHVKEKFGCNNQNRWKIIEKMGGKSLEEPCGVLMKGIEESEDMVWHFNGPVKEILNMCKHYYDLEGRQAPLDDEMTQKILQANQNMEHDQLITIAFACKRVHAQPQDVENLILIALLGLKNMKEEDTYAQIKELRERRIKTVIVSSKKISVLQDIALECEVFGESQSLVITGEVFRNYTDNERLEKVDNIRILGEARPSDKLLLVETMMKKGVVVAYLGQRTDEVPALKRANIGVAMGTWSSKQAIANCDIILGDENFAHLISIVDSGKNINYNIQSYLQIVLSMTISSTLISFIETAAFGDASLTVFQLAWVTFAVSFLGGLALLTKPSTDNLARSVPISSGQSVITAKMIRNILSQMSYLTICSLIIQLTDIGASPYKKAVVSNIFIFCQFFNLFVAREQQKKNFFKGIHRHKEFWVAIVVCIFLHTVIVMVQDVIGYGIGLKWKLWVGCVLLGMVSWLVDWFGKCIYGFIMIFVNKLRSNRST